jgi:hypothetical protein
MLSRLALTAALIGGALAIMSTNVAAARAQVCGGIADPPCGPGTFCQRPTGKCGGADIRGTCTRVPQLCSNIFRPVCGCDNRTYTNDCIRLYARMSKKHNGVCRNP